VKQYNTFGSEWEGKTLENLDFEGIRKAVEREAVAG